MSVVNCVQPCISLVCECVSVLLLFVFGVCVDCCDYGKVI